jgi:hypothetical protein
MAIVDLRLAKELSKLASLEDMNANGFARKAADGIERLIELTLPRHGPGRGWLPVHLGHNASLRVPQPRHYDGFGDLDFHC